ncbi:hypothetical protein D3C71_1728470 [compost metagenome]
MGVEVESAGDQDVKPSIDRFARGGDEILPADRAVFRSDQDCCTTFRPTLAFDEGAACSDKLSARPGREAVESDAVALVLLLDAFCL